MQHCLEWQPVLTPFQNTIDFAVNHNSRDAYVCGHHEAMCQSIPEHQTNSDDCVALFTGCQGALRHLHAMMFTHSPETRFDGQVCNNFARKSVRGKSPAPARVVPHLAHRFWPCRQCNVRRLTRSRRAHPRCAQGSSTTSCRTKSRARSFRSTALGSTLGCALRHPPSSRLSRPLMLLCGGAARALSARQYTEVVFFS